MKNQSNEPRVGFFRRLASSLFLQGMFFLLALVLLVVLVYGVENWRGKRAWQACKFELAKNGELIGSAAITPAPVPDEDNVFAAPKMKNWFVGRGNTDLNRILRHPDPQDPLTAATISVVSTGTPQAIRLGDAVAALRMKETILANLGPSLKGPREHLYLTQRAAEMSPLQLTLQADHQVKAEEVLGVFPPGFASTKTNSADFLLQSDAPNTFKLVVAHPIFASDYLKNTEPSEAALKLIQEALKRPYANLPGDYSNFASIPTANFVSIRNLAQALAERAQCHLLLNQPELALQDLTLLHESCRLLTTGGKSINLVSSMVENAVCQLYVNTIAEGLRMNAWSPECLTILQTQLKTIQLGDGVHMSMKMERAGCCSLLESIAEKRAQFPDLSLSVSQTKLLKVVPLGWYYQNLVTYSRIMQVPLSAYSEKTHSYDPAVLSNFKQETDRLSEFHAYSVFAAMCVPNCTKAFTQCANNQALVNQALIACALERFHYAEKHYPRSLAEMMPNYLGSIPTDPVKGQPLHYACTDGKRFVLYSIGWDAKDDGGNPERDWVWR